MILGTPTVYECDNAACSKQENGHTRRPPKEWKTVRWVPGVIAPAGMPEQLLNPLRWHYCSATCLETDKPRREAHEARVHAAIEENTPEDAPSNGSFAE